MAYKYQLGDARLSGSLIQEGDVTAESSNLSGSTISLANASGIAGTGFANSGGELKLDLSGISNSGFTPSADKFAFLDMTDNSTKLTDWTTIATDTAGAGLTSNAGVFLSLRAKVVAKSNGNTLESAFNRLTLGSDGEHSFTLPASAGLRVGDPIIIKAPSDCSGTRFATINRAGSQTIDGHTSIRLESPHAAVELIYVAADTFSII